MNTRNQQPPSNSPSLMLPRMNEQNQGRRRVLNLELVQKSTSQIEIFPGVDNFDGYMHQIWIKDHVYNYPYTRNLVASNYNTYWRLDATASGINTTTYIGGRLDGLALAANSRYLIWAIANAANNEIEGFGCTRKPFANWTAISSGTQNSLATLTLAGTGTNNAAQFTAGKRVTVRSGAGTTPNFQFNHGIIEEIISNTSMTVRLDNRTIDASTTVTATAPNEIEQWEGFRPWNGGTTAPFDQNVYSKNYRLIGEFATDDSSAIVWLRRADDPWVIEEFDYPTVSRTTVGTTTTTYHLWRYLPLWAREVHITNEVTKATTVTNARAQLAVANRFNTPSATVDMPGRFDGTSVTTVSGSRFHLAQGDTFTVANIYTTGSGSHDIITTINGYWDGGLRD